MQALGAYILSVAGGAMICALSMALVEKQSTGSTIVKMVCGVVMAVIVIRPLDQVIDLGLSDHLRDLEIAADFAVEAGIAQQQDLLTQRISAQTAAYILDKAETLGLALEVEVLLSEDRIPVPVTVILTGNTSPAAKAILQQIIEQDLNIGKEDQIWTSNPASES